MLFEISADFGRNKPLKRGCEFSILPGDFIALTENLWAFPRLVKNLPDYVRMRSSPAVLK